MSGITIVHGSDIHFGKPHDSEAAEAFLRATEALSPDLLVFSGDFTQRAKVREYRAAREYLKRFPDVPTVVTPGNHDVPLYRVFERIFVPFRNYRAFIRNELDTVTRVTGATVVSLNTADPHRSIVNGRLHNRQLAYARQAFEAAAEGELRILVAHHHLVSAPDEVRDHPLPDAVELLGLFADMGVDLILGGHLHRGYVASSLDIRAGDAGEREILIVHSGTTTSRRGRAGETGIKSFNQIRVEADRLEVTPYHFVPADGEFAPRAVRTVPRVLPERGGR
jgi:3',5'-cyclic AMP phosphodiesterase CpdA